MDFTPLSTISPIDGRYHSKTSALQPYFSEFGLIRYRVLIEIEYFIALMKTGVVPNTELISEEELRSWYIHFTPSDANELKQLNERPIMTLKRLNIF
jgi:adenylosuccinate lyase